MPVERFAMALVVTWSMV